MDCFNFPVLQRFSHLTELTNMQRIELAEYMLKKVADGAGEIELPLTHHIYNGLYAREIFLPKDTVLTGKVHNFDHLSIISKGDVTVMTPDGIERIVGPYTFQSKAGVKRLIYVHEDTIWTTFHITDLTDPDEIVKHIAHDSDLSWIGEELLLSGDSI